MVDLKGYGVGLYLHAQAVDTTTPGGKALLQMAGVFAEFEREMIRERVLAGQARARASGVRFGRPTIPADKAAAIDAGRLGDRPRPQARISRNNVATAVSRAAIAAMRLAWSKGHRSRNTRLGEAMGSSLVIFRTRAKLLFYLCSRSGTRRPLLLLRRQLLFAWIPPQLCLFSSGCGNRKVRSAARFGPQTLRARQPRAGIARGFFATCRFRK